MSNYQKEHIFKGYKALGLISNHVPICLGFYKKRGHPFVVTCIGKAFHTYTCPKLGIVNISDFVDENITSLKCDSKFVYAAVGKKIYVFTQFKKIFKTLKGHTSKVLHILPFGEHLISIDTKNKLKLWSVKEEEEFGQMDLGDFKVSSLLHPRDYTNKLLLGGVDGKLKLVNLMRNQVVYEFRGWGSSVSCLQQSQAVNVVGIGLTSGDIIIHHLLLDKSLMRFKQEWGAVTAIAFRTDIDKLMVSGSELGHFAVWDLEKKKLICQLEEAHLSPVSSLISLPNQSLLLSSGEDNSLKLWIFDDLEGKPRLLSSRSGHRSPPSKIIFHSPSQILSAGTDHSLQLFSTIHHSENLSLGRGTSNRKMLKRHSGNHDYKHLLLPPILDFVSETARQSEWDNILCCHENSGLASTWNFNKSTIGKFIFRSHFNPQSSIAKCVHISGCGNFGLVGFNSGEVSVYNLQSGLHRGCYGDDNQLDLAHQAEVTGVVVDGLNRVTMTTGMDGYVKFWRFKSKQIIFCKKMVALPLKIIIFRENNLVALAMDDFSVLVVDIETKKVVRKLKGHTNNITDMGFGRGGRWLITSCLDCFIRTFDLSTSLLLDKFKVSLPATSLSVSQTSQLLATTHLNQLGIFLWYNSTLYQRIEGEEEEEKEEKEENEEEVEIENINKYENNNFKNKLEKEEEEEEEVVGLPKTKCDEKGEEEKIDEINLKKNSEISSLVTKQPKQINNLATLSNLGQTRWLSLFHYDVIKEKNKPREKLKKPENAPFFLPTISGLDFEFDFSKMEEEDQEKKQNKASLFVNIMKAKLHTLLQQEEEEEEEEELKITKDTIISKPQIHKYYQIINYLISLNVSNLDTELRCLSLNFGGSSKLMLSFLRFMIFWVSSNNQLDMANAILNRLIQLHSEDLIEIESENDTNYLDELLILLREKTQKLRQNQDTINCLTSFVRGAV